MALDLSRIRFDAHKDFLGVIMQQGRVQLDSDWNDWVAQLARRIQAGALDTFGPAVVPRETPDGFLIDAIGGGLTIGAGRMYVDGLLAENHGEPPADTWDERLAELTSTEPIDYTAQPYLPNAPALPATPGPHLVYLDVWQRELGHLQDPSLVESAVGVDSTGRLQTVWQVKVLPDVGNITCATDDEDIPNWLDTIAPSAGRLTTSTGDPPGEPDPCRVPPGAGYLGLENQLYRVEIHTPGPLGTATFKWSRDNATVATRVTHVNATGDRLTVVSVGKDDVLRFNDGDWVEVTDDWRELSNLPGELRRIKLGGGVDDANRTIELESPLTAGLFPVSPQDETDPERHTLVRRWDQGGPVRREDGSELVNLDDAGSTGEIPVPPAGTKLFLEHGILVEFDQDPAGGEFRSGDYWVIAARSVDASIELLDFAPPLGIHHHYARLALVTFPDDESDCRIHWPPAGEGESCDCTVCVEAEAHNAGTATIQQAIDAVKDVGGTVCLGAGTYHIDQPVRIDGAQSLRMRGQGWKTILLSRKPGPVIDVSGGLGVAIQNLTVIGSAADDGTVGMVSASNVIDFRLDHCNVLGISREGATSVALLLSGLALGGAVTDCAFVAEVGVASAGGREAFLLMAQWRAEDNFLLCLQRGFTFEGLSLHSGACVLSDNLVLGCSQASVVTTGGVLPGSSFTVSGNVLHTLGTGIRAGTDELRIRDNEIKGLGGERAGGDGIVLVRGLDPIAIDRAQIIGNRIVALAGRGLVLEQHVESAMIKQNVIDGLQGAGLVVEKGGSAGHLSIENNQFLNLGDGLDTQSPFAGLQLVTVERADFVDNVVAHVGRTAVSSPLVLGLAVGAVGELRMAGNRLHGIGPDRSAGSIAALRAITPFRHLAVDDNSMRRTSSVNDKPGPAAWQAIRIDDGVTSATAAGVTVAVAAETFFHLRAEATAFVLTATRIHAIPVVSSELSVRGNRLLGREIRTPLAMIADVGTCLFSENHCQVEGRLASSPVHGHFQAFVNNVANNRLFARDDMDTLHLFNAGKRAVVLGNVSTGNIRVDGVPLPPPWDDLNLIGS